METKFEMKTKMNKEKLVKTNSIELKMMRRIFLTLSILGIVLSIFNLILQRLHGSILPQDIKDLLIAALVLALAIFIPQLVSFIQIPVYKLYHLDGKRKISITDDVIKIQSENYPEKSYETSLITKILDRSSYYKIMIGNRRLYIHKEDFTKGDPEHFFEYIKSGLIDE